MYFEKFQSGLQTGGSQWGDPFQMRENIRAEIEEAIKAQQS